MKRIAWFFALSLGLLAKADSAHSFCGFYVAKADTKIFNKASQVVLVRHDDKTVITMVNDFKGDPKEFAVVIPVPTLIEKGQINVGDKKVIDHLDAYTSPRLGRIFRRQPVPARAPGAAHEPRCSDAGFRRSGPPRRSPRRHGSSAIHGRRIRHRHSLGEAGTGTRNLAQGKRLSLAARRLGSSRQLHQTKNALLRRQGESPRAVQARLQLSASDPGGV